MNTPVTLDRARPDDYGRMLAVWEASVRATHHFLTEANIQFFKPLVRDALAAGLSLVCVRDASGQVVGFTGVADSKIEMLFIDPLWRGKGIGKRLLHHAVTVLNAAELDVNEQNEQAVGFYQSAGFVMIGRSAVDGLGKPFPLLHMRLSE